MPPAADTARLLVTETFGPTLQGEGPSLGEPALFIRLSRCNLTCQWCDEPHTWDTSRFDLQEHTRTHTVRELARWAQTHPTELVVITGGEPLLHQQQLVGLVDALVASGKRVEIETNGTIAPLPEIRGAGVRLNVSPKLASSGVSRSRRYHPEALSALSEADSICKFVVTTAHRDADLAEADQLVAEHPFRQVWLMPEGITEPVVRTGLRLLADHALVRGWSLTPRLHVTIWGNQHGH